MSFAPQPKGRHCIPSTATPDQPKATPRRSSRKKMCSRYLDEDMVTLEDSSLWSPALSRALQERYGDSGRKRTPRTLTRLMQQHRENERHRHHGLNASIRAISQRIPGFDEDNKETKIVKLQRIINYICHLEQNIKKDCDDIGFSLDYKNLFLSPHITKNPDEWKPGLKSSPPHHEPLPKKYATFCLKQHLEDKDPGKCTDDQKKEEGGSPVQHLLPPYPAHLPPGTSCGHSPLHKHAPPSSRHPSSTKTPRGKGSSRAARGKGRQKGSALVPRKTAPCVAAGGKACQDHGHTHTDLLPYTDGGGVTGLSHGGEEEDLDWLDSMMESATVDMNDMCRELLHLPDLLPDLGEPQQLQHAPRHHILSPPTWQHGPGHHLVNLDTWQHGPGKHIMSHECLPHGPGHYMMSLDSLQQHPGHYLISPKNLHHSSRLYLMSPGQCMSPESLQHGSDQHLMDPESLQHASDQHLMGPESLQHASDQHLMGPESLQHASDQHLMSPESLQHASDQHLMSPESLQHASDQHLMSPESLQHASDQHLMSPESLQHASDQHLMSPESLQHASDQHLMGPESLQHASDQHLMGPESLQHASDQQLMGPEHLQYSPGQYLASPESMHVEKTAHPDNQYLLSPPPTDSTGRDTTVYHPVPCGSSPSPPPPPAAQEAVSSWEEGTNVSPSLVDVSTFHSYARINNDVTCRLLNDWELQMDEEGSVSPQRLTIHDPADPHNTLLTTQHYPTALTMQIQLDEVAEDLSVEMATRGQHPGLTAIPVKMSADHPTLPPGDVQAAQSDDLNASTCNEERGDKPVRVDLRKTSWMNGFMVYSRLHRKQYIDDNPGVHTSHISHLMGVDWRKLTFSDQQPYREKARIYVENHLMPQLVTNFKRNKKTTKKH